MKNGIALFALATCVLVGCAGPNEVSVKRPVFYPVPVGRGSLANAEAEISKGLKENRNKPTDALDEYLTAAQTAERQLLREPRDATAKRDYNFAVGRILEIIQEAKLDPWKKPLTVPGANGDFVLVHIPDPRPEWNPKLYDFTPADQFDVHGKFVTERTTRDGIGAPIVAVEREHNVNARESFAPSRVFYSVTAVARFQGRRCVLSFEDPLSTETVKIDGHTFPLAGDFTVPLAVMLDTTDPNKHILGQLLNPEKFASTAQVERLQPYDPKKTIVLVIHGLMSSQATWTPMINTLRGDPEIRKHYQFWFYSYPSGYPYPYSAAVLRDELDRVEKVFPNRKPMVLIGHSMGGCISRLLITDSGEQLWMKIFGRPPEEVPLSPHTRQLFTEDLIFRHRPEIGHVIFISAPLRGSNLATSWVGRIGASLVKAPSLLRVAHAEMLSVTNINEDELKLKRAPNSVDTLSPKSRFVQAINTIPITPGIPYDTIIGDRGRGDSPNSSDGIVPYWSSHMDGAKSEEIVPSGHAAQQNPQAIKDVLHLLKRYARESRRESSNGTRRFGRTASATQRRSQPAGPGKKAE
ncbi:MAG: esterase/lipase family protein [Chthoniobacterales bacterium]